MTQKKKVSVNVKPSRELQAYIRYGMKLEESLNDEMFAEKMLLVRHRIIGIFNRSIDPLTGKGVQDNYLIGVGHRLRSLKIFILKHFGARGVIFLEDLHPRYQVLTDYWRQQVTSIIVSELVERQLCLMLEEGDLWWQDNCGGIWEICQSVADEYEIHRIQVSALYGEIYKTRKSKQPYRDERAHHGRPSKQGRRRDSELRQAPGLSIGTARYGT